MMSASKTIAALASSLLLSASVIPSAQAATPTPIKGASPAQCSRGDTPEPGIQGEVPTGQTASYNCGVKLIGQLPVAGNVAAASTCAYVRSRGKGSLQDDGLISVIDVSNPAKPVLVGSPLPVLNATESMRVVVTKERAILVSGSSVYDIADCLHPKLLGEIQWPDTALAGVARKNFPHDMRVNHSGTRV